MIIAMKGKRWLAFKITAAALVFASFCAAFAVKQVNEYLFWVFLLVTGLIGFALVGQLIIAQNNIHQFISRMDDEINVTERESLYNFPAPSIIIDSDGKIIWYNQAFSEQIYTEDSAFGVNLNKILRVDFDKINTKKGTVIEYKEKYYRVASSTTKKEGATLSMVYFEDVTELTLLREEYSQSKPSVVLITVDNYEDLFQDIKESEKAHVLVQLEKLFENFMEKSAGIIRKISNDKFFAIVEEKRLNQLIEERFKILDNARAITVSDRLTLTLSIGVGHGGANLAESEELAKQALDMALGRGGDQAAVKTENGFEFFGGVSKGIEKHAKVKTRIIATALTELIESSDRVYIMGHSFGDLDSVGSAVGLGGAIHNLGKHVKVVVDPEKNLSQPLIRRMEENEDFNLFITPGEALAEINDQTLLIIVDTHNKDYLDCYDLYERAKHVVVIDHHRKTVNYIENAVIFHHEPYASSASEMVAELIQYFGEVGKLSSYYAEALMAGIMLDTKNFVMRTGVRTFEAAAFLRKLGADTVAVRGLFANSIDAYQKKGKLVSAAEVYNRCAIVMNDDNMGEEVRVIAAQAADELLGVAGVDASFVIYKAGESVNFSARSMGAMNVQLIMEKLGGGGHQTMAGAQLQGISLKAARQKLIEAIDKHLEEIS